MKEVKFSDVFTDISKPMSRRRLSTRFTMDVPAEGLKIVGDMPDQAQGMNLSFVEHQGVRGVFYLSLLDGEGDEKASTKFAVRSASISFANYTHPRVPKVGAGQPFSLELVHKDMDGQQTAGKTYLVLTQVKA